MPDLRLPVFPASDDIEHPEYRQLADSLRRMIRGEVRFGRHDRMLYSTDASMYQVEPIGVVVPASIEEVPTIVQFAAKYGLDLLPRGGGTSLAGQCVNRAVVLDLSKYCRSIVEVDVANKTARVEPGVVLNQLNASLAQCGLMFGPDVATASHATIGGMIGNNSAGAHSVLYGRTVEHLISMQCVMGDGRQFVFAAGADQHDRRLKILNECIAKMVRFIAPEIRERFPKIKRHVDGYNLDIMLDQVEASTPGTLDALNLAHLICGAEGTLAITTEATLDLVDAPTEKALAIVGFDTVDDAMAALTTILDTHPAAVELLDDVVMNMARQNSVCREYLKLIPDARDGKPANAVLYVEYFGSLDQPVREQLAKLTTALPTHTIAEYVDSASMQQAWALRKSGEPLLHAVPGLRKPVTFIEDTAVAPARLGEFVKRFRTIVNAHDTFAAYYAHASVGCLHIRPMIDLRSADDRNRMESIAREVTDLVKEFGGAVSGEHGDGRARSHLLEQFYGPAICDTFAKVKELLDPDNRLNPGNLVNPMPGEMQRHLRVKPHEEVVEVSQDIDTFYEYKHGFGEAVDQCNGAGVCRKTLGGTMCPSYRGTLEERHATRGRGNALRLAITGQLSGHAGSVNLADWNDAETLATLDLCLSCKACKAECPSNVDIARLKSEYLGQRYRSGEASPTLATKMMADVRTLNKRGSRWRMLANPINRFFLTRWLINRVINLHPKRSLPTFDRSLFDWNKGRSPNRGAADQSQVATVILYPDCFSVYNETRVGKAAIGVLEHLGYRVILPESVGCCARPQMSLGMMDDAVVTCENSAAALAKLISQHNPAAIITLEPSCESALTDDWQSLKMKTAKDVRARIADLTCDIGTFIEAHLQSTQCNVHSASSQNGSDHEISDRAPGTLHSEILIHGHCHAKAMHPATTLFGPLERLAGAKGVQMIDAGCCGMAGSFGFLKHRYDLSMTIGSLQLFPAIESKKSATIVAAGTSCRHQIKDATGREALHPIEVIADLLGVKF